MKYVSGDGWELENIQPLESVVNSYDTMSKDIYELKNCVRTKSLIEMRDDLLKEVITMKYFLEKIDDNDEVVSK